MPRYSDAIDPATLPSHRLCALDAYFEITGRRMPHAERMKAFYTYAMACPKFIKVGRCDHITRRLRQVQTYCPYPVRLLGFVVEDIEGTVFKTLASAGIRRVRGEWFRDTKELRRHLASFGLTRAIDG